MRDAKFLLQILQQGIHGGRILLRKQIANVNTIIVCCSEQAQGQGGGVTGMRRALQCHRRTLARPRSHACEPESRQTALPCPGRPQRPQQQTRRKVLGSCGCSGGARVERRKGHNVRKSTTKRSRLFVLIVQQSKAYPWEAGRAAGQVAERAAERVLIEEGVRSPQFTQDT